MENPLKECEAEETGTPKDDELAETIQVLEVEETPSPLGSPEPGTSQSKRAEESTIKTPTKATSEDSLPKSPENFTKEEWRFNSLGVPKCPLPCRESQFEEIWTFLNDNITYKYSRCMYVSGVPGTGKTVIVRSVVDTLSSYANECNENLQFQSVYINGLSLDTPANIWKRFYCGLKDKTLRITPQTAIRKLNLYFETMGRRPTVLVIDELDQILDKKQAILYQLLEWAAHHSTMFSFIAIFNTMSLPESGLTTRIISRISLTRCIFPPYTHDQLETIVRNSLAASKSEKLKDEALTLLSKKVAAVSGDARRALDLSKRAVEIIESGQSSGMIAVNTAFKEMFSSPRVATMHDCSVLEQMFLRTLSAELASTGSEETTLVTVYSNLRSAAIFEGYDWSLDQVVRASVRLSSMKLIIAENSNSIHKRISLNVPVEDINFALGLQLSVT